MIDHVFILLAALYAVLRGLKTLHPDAEFDAECGRRHNISTHLSRAFVCQTIVASMTV